VIVWRDLSKDRTEATLPLLIICSVASALCLIFIHHNRHKLFAKSLKLGYREFADANGFLYQEKLLLSDANWLRDASATIDSQYGKPTIAFQTVGTFREYPFSITALLFSPLNARKFVGLIATKKPDTDMRNFPIMNYEDVAIAIESRPNYVHITCQDGLPLDRSGVYRLFSLINDVILYD